MGHYCARTPKRHYGYANSPWISSLDKGVLSGWKKGDRKVKTAVSYTNKDGKKCYKGTPALRSEYLAHIFDLIISYIIVYTKFIPVLYHIYKKQKRYGVKTTSSILVNSHSFFLRSSKLRRREAEIDCCWTWFLLLETLRDQWYVNLRVYPLQFGRAMVDMMPQLLTSARGQPQLPDHVPPGAESVMAMPNEEFGLGYTRLQDVYNYLRRGKNLVIPPEWASLIPAPS